MIETGGPAFPGTGELYIKYVNGKYECPAPGMTLLDYFAGQALTMEWSGRPSDADCEPTCERIAQNAYRVAQAMLTERARLMEGK